MHMLNCTFWLKNAKMLAMGIRQTKKTKEDGIFWQEITSLREDFSNKNFCCIFIFSKLSIPFISCFICVKTVLLKLLIELPRLKISRLFQVQKVYRLHRGLPGEDLPEPSVHRTAAEALVHPRSADRAPGAHPAERPHRPHAQEAWRER